MKGKVERDFQCQLYPLRSTGRHVAPLGHIILIQRQPVIKNQLYCFWLDLTGARTYDLRHMLTITPLIWLKQQRTSILYNVATRVRIIIIPHILITINRLI